MKKFQVVVKCSLGIHARPAAQIAQSCSSLRAAVTLETDHETAQGNNVLEILKEANAESFVIMDELGSGTDPAEGMGIAIAILEELRGSGANFLVTTHYPEVKEYANRTEDVLNARMVFDKETLRPTYQMIIGEAGESCAFYIADRLGMPNEMLRVAIAAAYGEDAVENYVFQKPETSLGKRNGNRIAKHKRVKAQTGLKEKYHIGDSVMVYPDKRLASYVNPLTRREYSGSRCRIKRFGLIRKE